MNNKIKITISVCYGEQGIELYSDPENKDCIIMNCIEIEDSSKNFKVYLNTEEALLLSEQLKQYLDEKV
jgi:hypothetical protein